MKAAAATQEGGVARFRMKLLGALMLLLSGVTILALYFAQSHVATTVAQGLEREFQRERDAVRHFHAIRQGALSERCRALVHKPRIVAAFEDDALDLLYPSAKDELRDIMASHNDPWIADPAGVLNARFYRFLDSNGDVIPALNPGDVGSLRPEEEARLALPYLPDEQQTGYLVHRADDGSESISELIAMPIFSSETGEVMASIVLGFIPAEPQGLGDDSGITIGIWLDGRLFASALSSEAAADLGEAVNQRLEARDGGTKAQRATIGGAPCLVFHQRFNPGSLFPPVYEAVVYPLAGMIERQRQLRWQIIGAGAVLLLLTLAAGHVLFGRLSRPVETLAIVSAENRVQRQRAEAALEETSEELQRSARFSADASHQLKTPVAVLRAGLEYLLARKDATPEECNEIDGLMHQTYRLNCIIDDLLLLAQLDAGRLKISFAPIDLTGLVEGWLDDFRALNDSPDLKVETELQSALHVAGERRFTTLIVQNLLENARKYNRPDGRLRIATSEKDGWVRLSVGNNGRTIGQEARGHIFERFHRGSMGENIPGNGLGLNLARMLARLHGGDLRLVSSDNDWTEFEAVFRTAPVAVPPLVSQA